MFLRAKPLSSKRSSRADRIAVVSYSLGEAVQNALLSICAVICATMVEM